MTLQADLDTANQVLATAQEAQVKAQAAYDAAQPHMSLWNRVEAKAVTLEAEVSADFLAIVAEARNLLGI